MDWNDEELDYEEALRKELEELDGKEQEAIDSIRHWEDMLGDIQDRRKAIEDELGI